MSTPEMLLAMLVTPPNPALIDALETEMARSESLILEDAPEIYSLRYHLAQLDQFSMVASFGSVLREDRSPFQGLGVEVRVGSPEFDNTGFGGWEDGFVATGVADDITPLALRQTAWRLTDLAYKQAVEQHARKSAQFTPPPDYPGDYTPLPPVVAEAGWGSPFEAHPIRERALTLSKVFAEVGDQLLLGEVHVGMESGGVLLLDSDGSQLTKPLSEITLRAVAQLRTDDGETLTDHRLWTVQTAKQLPSEAAMVAEVTAMRDRLLARSSVPALKDEYVGPVVFEDEAALDLFRHVLASQLEGTPPQIPYDSWFGDMGDRKTAVRVGRRVLPDGWRASDDPTADPAHPSSFVYDWEGVKAEKVDLVEDGIVKDLLMSRTPRKGLSPNGHARGFLGTRANGRVTQLTVTPPQTKRAKRLRKKALQMARAYGRDHIFVIRRLQDDSARVLGSSGAIFGMRDHGPTLPPPVELLRVSSDGTETVVRSAQFASIQRFVLRDIAMAGPIQEGSYLAPRDGDSMGLSPTEGMPTRIQAPEVLVREVELVPTTGDPRDTPVLLPPAP